MLTAGTVMHDPACLVDADEDVSAARAKLAASGSPIAFVVDGNGAFRGTLGAGDLEANGPDAAKAASVAHNDVQMVDTAAKLDSLILATARDDRPLPVVDQNKRLVGTIDRTTIMLALATDE